MSERSGGIALKGRLKDSVDLGAELAEAKQRIGMLAFYLGAVLSDLEEMQAHRPAQKDARGYLAELDREALGDDDD